MKCLVQTVLQTEGHLALQMSCFPPRTRQALMPVVTALERAHTPQGWAAWPRGLEGCGGGRLQTHACPRPRCPVTGGREGTPTGCLAVGLWCIVPLHAHVAQQVSVFTLVLHMRGLLWLSQGGQPSCRSSEPPVLSPTQRPTCPATSPREARSPGAMWVLGLGPPCAAITGKARHLHPGRKRGSMPSIPADPSWQ